RHVTPLSDSPGTRALRSRWRWNPCFPAHLLPWWSAAQCDLISVGIAVGDLAHAARVGFLLRRLESSIGYLRDPCIEVIDEAQVHGVASVLRSQHNIHVPMRSQLPHGLSVVRKERGLRAQQPGVP